jgi:hypothetical protein
MSPQFSSAADWDEYRTFLNGYYLLDNQKFESVSCTVVNPVIQPTLDQLKPLEKNVKITESFNQFRLSYTRNGTPQLKFPKFDIEIISKEGMASPEKAEEGIKMIRDGVEHIISGSGQMISGLFDEYMLPKQSTLKNFKFHQENNESYVSYEKSGSQVSNRYSGQGRETTQHGSNLEAQSQDQFSKLGSTLALTSSAFTITQGQVKIKGTLKVEYQTLGASNFPSHISGTTSIDGPNFHQQGVVDVFFKDCTWK